MLLWMSFVEGLSLLVSSSLSARCLCMFQKLMGMGEVHGFSSVHCFSSFLRMGIDIILFLLYCSIGVCVCVCTHVGAVEGKYSLDHNIIRACIWFCFTGNSWHKDAR